MKLLAIDTSTEICSICILEEEKVAAEYMTRSERTHTARLMPALDMLLQHLGWGREALGGLAVVNGPGSFTGLRICLSVVKGLSLGLNLKVATAGALEVAAHQVPHDGWICPAMDARRGEIFTCLYQKEQQRLILKVEPRSITPHNWVNLLPAEPILFCGPGAGLYWPVLKNHEDSKLIFTEFILARTLAHLAREKHQSGEVISGSELRAAYLRPSDAETKGPRSRKKLEHISG